MKNFKFLGQIYILFFILSFAIVAYAEKAEHIHSTNIEDKTLQNNSSIIKYSDPQLSLIPEKIRQLQQNLAWRSFLKNKELMDINYDLYRMTGPTIKDNAIAQGAGDPHGYLVMKHDQVFCSPHVDQNCKLADFKDEYADIKFSILLDQDIYTEPKQIHLASEFIKNITNPFPSKIALEMLSAGNNERRAPQNQAAFAEALVQEARSAVAKHSFNNMILNRLSLSAVEGNGVMNNKNFSQLSLMEQEAKSRFEDNVWRESIEKANNDSILREMAKMEAFKIWMEYHKYKQNERIEALLATIVSEQSSINQLLREQKSTHGKNN